MNEVRNIHLAFSHEDFEKLKAIKEKTEESEKLRLSWEKFVWKHVVGK